MKVTDENLDIHPEPRPALQRLNFIERIVSVAFQAFGYGMALAWTQFAGQLLDKNKVKRRKNRALIKE